LQYFMGRVDRVYAETQLWEKRRDATGPESTNMKAFYEHRQLVDVEQPGVVECTSEDMASGVIRFESGAMANFLNTIAAPGNNISTSIIYCDDGSISLSPSRTGSPSSLTRIGEEQPISTDDLLNLVPEFELDEMTAKAFGASRISSYKMDFPLVDATLIALELEDFAEAIRTGSRPEVTGQVGLEAVALTYAFLESGYTNEPVQFTDVVSERTNLYQQEINDHYGLG